MEAPLVAVCMYYVCMYVGWGRISGPTLQSWGRLWGASVGSLGEPWGAFGEQLYVCMYVCRSLGAPLVSVCTYLAGVASGCQLGEAGAVSGEQVYGVWESLGAPLGSNCM